MTNLEQENLLRATFEKICRDTTDPETIGRRTLAYAQALDCPSAKRMTPGILAKKVGVTRQAVDRQIQRSISELSEIKAACVANFATNCAKTKGFSKGHVAHGFPNSAQPVN